MNRRIGLWMLTGLALACCWVATAALTPHTYNLGYWARQHWIVAAITAPASLIGQRMPLGLALFIVLNAAMYTVAGSVIELVRWPLSQHHWKRTSA